MVNVGVQGVYLDNIETREINEEDEVQLLLADSDHNRYAVVRLPRIYVPHLAVDSRRSETWYLGEALF